MKNKYILKYAIKVIDKIPLNLLEKLISFLYLYNNKLFLKIIKKINFDKLISVNNKHLRKYQIQSHSEASLYKIHVIAEVRFEDIPLPDVYQLAQSNSIKILQPEIALYCFPQAQFEAKSDIIKVGEKVFWEKANRPEFTQNIPADCNFIAINELSREIIVLQPKNKIKHYDVGFNLCGVHIDSWSHFIAIYLPKIVALDNFKINKKINIFVPKTILENCKDLINHTIEKIVNNNLYNVVYINDNEPIECDELYHCSSIGYLCDHSTYVHPSSISLSRYGVQAIKKICQNFSFTPSSRYSTKLYIGRVGGRNLLNVVEVENYFIKNGFDVIYPNLMTIKEKVEAFGNATHICGPVSSGFANLIFCRKKTKILGFINFARCFDSFFCCLNIYGNYEHKIMFITGFEQVNNDINNSYLIELKKINDCCREISFFE